MSSIDRIIANRFALEAPLAKGGESTVFRALDARTGKRVAVKLAVVDGAARARFDRETQALATVSHRRLPALVAAGTTDRDSEVFVAIELVEGASLRSLLGAPMSEARARALAVAVCEALEALHQRGLVHRDVKPENILLSDEHSFDSASLVDLGLALSSADPRVITAGGIVGTLGYLPPEQLGATPAPVTPRWDVFSLGCVLYECATGVAPFGARDPRDALARTLSGPASDARNIVASLSEEFASLLAAMIATRAADRPADATAVLAKLAAMTPARQASADEQPDRFIAVILGHPAAGASLSSTTPTVITRDGDGPSGIDAALIPRGARVRTLADGTLLLWLASPRLERAFAVRAVQCALLLADVRADQRWSVAISEGCSRNGWPVGQAFDRSIAMADECVHGHVAVDDVLSLLVDGAFTLRSLGKSQLIAAR